MAQSKDTQGLREVLSLLEAIEKRTNSANKALDAYSKKLKALNSKSNTQNQGSNSSQGNKTTPTKGANKALAASQSQALKAISGLVGKSGGSGLAGLSKSAMAAGPAIAAATVGITAITTSLTAMAVAGKKAAEINTQVAKAQTQLGLAQSEVSKEAVKASNNYIKLKNTLANSINSIQTAFVPFFNWLSTQAEKLLSSFGGFLGLDTTSSVNKAQSRITQGSIASGAKGLGFSTVSSGNLAGKTYQEALKLAEKYGESADSIAQKLADAWQTGSDAALEYGATVNSDVLTGFMASKGVDNINIQQSEATEAYYRFLLLQEQLEGSEAVQGQVNEWRKLGKEINATKQQLFSFDEVISLQAMDTSIPEVGGNLGSMIEEIESTEGASKDIINAGESQLGSLSDIASKIGVLYDSVKEKAQELSKTLYDSLPDKLKIAIDELVWDLQNETFEMPTAWKGLADTFTDWLKTEYPEYWEDGKLTFTEAISLMLQVITDFINGDSKIQGLKNRLINWAEKAFDINIHDGLELPEVLKIIFKLMPMPQLVGSVAEVVEAFYQTIREKIPVLGKVSDILYLDLPIKILTSFNDYKDVYSWWTGFVMPEFKKISVSDIIDLFLKPITLPFDLVATFSGFPTFKQFLDSLFSGALDTPLGDFLGITTQGGREYSQAEAMWESERQGNLNKDGREQLQGLEGELGWDSIQLKTKFNELRDATDKLSDLQLQKEESLRKATENGADLATLMKIEAFYTESIQKQADVVNKLTDEYNKSKEAAIKKRDAETEGASIFDRLKKAMESLTDTVGNIIRGLATWASSIPVIGDKLGTSLNELADKFDKAFEEAPNTDPLGTPLLDAFVSSGLHSQYAGRELAVGNYMTGRDAKGFVGDKLGVNGLGIGSSIKHAEGGISLGHHIAEISEGNKAEAIIPLESTQGIEVLAQAMGEAMSNNTGAGVGYNLEVNITLPGNVFLNNNAQLNQLAELIASRIDIQRERRGSLGYGLG